MISRNVSLFLLTLAACLGFSFVAIKITGSTPIKVVKEIANEAVDAPLIFAPGASNAIQVALLLDTSSSMDGLIEQAKSQLWNILNELARTKKKGQDTQLQIALYEYGNPRTANSDYQIHQLTEFTSDMDLISEKLFSLKTNGGEEYCGAVIRKSLDDLEWHSGGGLRMIYIAGNEPFNQGPIDFKEVCRKAQANEIKVNTIFCGNRGEGVNGQWRLAATVGGGDFISISQDKETVYISTPYDDMVNKLNVELNDTYIPYGRKGKEKKSNQTRQDMNAKSYSIANIANRISYKTSTKYKADDWDLVDAYKKDKSILKNADIQSEKYSKMTVAELESNIEAVIQKRESIKAEIKELDKKRREYKEAEMKKNKKGQVSTLQESIIQTVRKQAKRKGFEFVD